MHARSLLVLAMLVGVGPAVAYGPAAAVPTKAHAKVDCPAARAKAEATARAKATWAAPKAGGGAVGARTVARSIEEPGEGSFFAIGRSSVLMP